MPQPVICHMFMTVFWSREYRHVTHCLMKFADGERNFANK